MSEAVSTNIDNVGEKCELSEDWVFVQVWSYHRWYCLLISAIQTQYRGSGGATRLGRENELISSEVDIDAEGAVGAGGGGKLGICLILNCKICGTWIKLPED